MDTVNPFEYARLCIAQEISRALGISINGILQGFEIPREEYGDLSIVLPKTGINPSLAEKVVEATRRCSIVSNVHRVGIYVNIHFERRLFTKALFNSLVSSRERFGIYVDPNPKRIVVEFVSANPLHPLHIGAARNAALGCFLTNILRFCGNRVQTRFYINDVGRQVALLALGALQLRNALPNKMKPDHWIGLVYAITNTVAEIKNIKKKLEHASVREREELQKELDELLVDASKLRKQAPEIFDTIAEKLKDIDIDAEVSKVMKSYESRDPEISRFIRELVSICIEGFKQTLSRFGVEIDVWDWESDLVWSGEVDNIIDSLEKSPLIVVHKGVSALDIGKIAEDLTLRKALSIDRDLEIPPLIFKRSDGTTLYTVRDIAYTLRKFREFQADKVINVIASEQKLPQAQLKLALYVLGYKREAENLIHYSYEIVTIENMKMSSRRGRLISLDEILDTAKVRALAELEARGNKSEEIAEKIGVAAVKFYLLSSSPSKPLKFSWKLALDFEKNSAPYLLYTFARTEGIFRKASEYGIDIDPVKLLNKADEGFGSTDQKRWRLVKLVSQFHDIVYNTYMSLDPSILVVYTLKLADEFNSWYNDEPILLEENESIRASKLLLTYGVNIVLKNSLRILGIEPLEKI
ncbi:MAG: arginine--tRNA ligase [Ignisphaera sp.]